MSRKVCCRFAARFDYGGAYYEPYTREIGRDEPREN